MTANNAEQALSLLSMEPNLALIELRLPDMNGLELLGRLREREGELPIIALTENGDTRTKVQALDLGANDFLSKPFDVEELAARIRVAFRRRFEFPVERPIYRCAQLEVDLRHRVAKVAEAEIHPHRRNMIFCASLSCMRGKVLTHQFLMSELWKEKVDTQFLRVYIRQLRNKIEENPARPKYSAHANGGRLPAFSSRCGV